jgi:hypothetical protein
MVRVATSKLEKIHNLKKSSLKSNLFLSGFTKKGVYNYTCHHWMALSCTINMLNSSVLRSEFAIVTTLNLGLQPRQGLARLWAKKEAKKSHLMLPRVQKNVKSETSHSQVNSHCVSWSPKWTSEFSEGNGKGQNPLVWRFFYIIGSLLKMKCLKWVSMTHLDIWNTSYGQKKGRESNWQLDSQPLKVKNRPNILLFRWRAKYHCKDLNEG